MRKIFLALLISSLWITSSKLTAQQTAQGTNTNFQPARQSPPKSPSTPPSQPPPAQKVAPQPATPATTSEVEKVSREEIRRRQEAQMMADQLIENGLKLYYNGQFEEAIAQLEQAIKTLPRAKATEVDYNRATHGLTDSYTHLAGAALRANDPAKAEQLAQKALEYDPRNRSASNVLAEAKEGKKRLALNESATPTQAPSLDGTPEFLAKKEEIKKLFREGRILLNSGQLDLAEQKFKQVLMIDRYNDDAYTLLDQVNQARIQFSESATDKSRTRLLWDVADAWVPKVVSEVKAPNLGQGPGIQAAPAVSQAQIVKKLNEIVFPEINFREAVISDVVTFLSEQSRKLDRDKVGVNIVLGGALLAAPQTAPGAAPASSLTPEGTTPPPSTPTTPGAAEATHLITLNLRNVPMIDALGYITTLANLKYRVESSAVVILPLDAPEPGMTTRMYHLNPGVFGDFVEPINFSPGGSAFTSTVAQAGNQLAQQLQSSRGSSGGGVTGFQALGTTRPGTLYAPGTSEILAFFTQSGVQFPTNSTLVYNARTSTLIVHNTAENLEKFEQVLDWINTTPPNVQIEAKFVDISQSDLDELGFQWGLGGKNMGSFGINGGQQLTPFGFPGGTAPTEGNLTTGLRTASAVQQNAIDALLAANGFGSSVSPQGQVATVSGILTDPQFSVVINALSQKSSTDLLSAPKVTVVSGHSAEIRVAEEFIYPTAFQPPTATAAGGGVNGGGAAAVTPSIPSSFSTREVGVLLDVVPSVGSDGYTINLALIPEVSEFLGFINYGGPISLAAGNNVVTTFNDIKQPLFSTRTVATSVVIWDGQTVVMGGMIREDVSVIDDKVPFLGDIPMLGRLFRSKVNSRTKRNLLMFVTARIVDPAGNPVHRSEMPTASATY